MTRKLLTATMLALALVGTVPAEAGGSFGITITASNGKERRAINQFLKAYAGATSAAQITQRGSDNAAAVEQTGKGNKAVVGQYGDDHTGIVRQSGRHNRLGLFQFGEGTDVEVMQTGRRGSTLMFVGGW